MIDFVFGTCPLGKQTRKFKVSTLLMLWAAVSMQFLNANSENSEDPHRHVLSHGMPVIMSSTDTTHVGSLATDGNYSSHAPHDKCSKTTISDYPYLQVDLGTSQYIFNIIFVFPSTAANVPKFSNMRLTAGDDQDPASTGNYVIVNGEELSNTNRYGFMNYARYITIQRMATGVYLGLCEVAAFSFPTENFAYRRVTYSTATVIYKGSYRAVDWILNSRYRTKRQSQSWFEINFGSVTFVHEIIIFASCSYEPDSLLADSEIRIGNMLKKRQKNPLCSNVNMSGCEIRSFYCNMFGKHLNILRQTYGALGFDEVVINPEKTSNIAFQKPVTCHFSCLNAYPCSRATNGRVTSEIRSVSGPGEKHLFIDLQSQRIVTMVYIISPFELRNIEIRVGTTLEDSQRCGSTLKDISKKFVRFVCQADLQGTRVFFHHLWENTGHFRLGEIAVFEETKPLIDDNSTDSFIWIEENKKYTLICDAKGYPSPIVSWVKDNELLKNASSALVMENLRFNQSGEYQCLARNEHGKDGRLYNIAISSGLRVCVSPVETIQQVTKLTPVEEFLKSDGRNWHSFYDDQIGSYLQIRESVPKNNQCKMWLNGRHPTFADGVVRRTLCVRNLTNDCSSTVDVNIRRCASQYIYNFKNLFETQLTLCYQRAPDFSGDMKPVLASPKYKHALFGFVFHTELNVSHSYQCMMMCQLEAKCKSFNFSNKLKLCELNSATEKEVPKKYQANMEYDFYNMMPGKVIKPRQEL